MSDNQALLREIDAEIECWSGVASSGQTVFAGQMTSLLTRCREALSAQPAEPKWRPIPKRGEPVELTSGPLQPIAAEPKEIRRTEYTPGGHPVSVVYDAPAAEPKQNAINSTFKECLGCASTSCEKNQRCLIASRAVDCTRRAEWMVGALGGGEDSVVAAAEPKDEQVERLTRSLRNRYGKNLSEDDDAWKAADLIESQARQIATLTAERDQLKDALDMATQGKYSALMLELADGVAKQIHAGIQVCTLKGDIETLTAEREKHLDEIERLSLIEIETGSELVTVTAENKRLRGPCLSDHPGCVYCMEKGTPVKPGCVCPKCGDRLPTEGEYHALTELRNVTAERDRAVEALLYLDKQGGLGFEKHLLIKKAIGGIPYPEFCHHADKCRGLSNCPRDPCCCD